jgi:hypothetical protein
MVGTLTFNTLSKYGLLHIAVDHVLFASNELAQLLFSPINDIALLFPQTSLANPVDLTMYFTAFAFAISAAIVELLASICDIVV